MRISVVRRVGTMRILLVSEIRLFPLMGGVQRHIYTLAKFLHRQGHEVTILTSRSKPDIENYLNLDGVRVLETLPHVRYKQAQWLYDAYNLMREISRHDDKYDVIHYHGGAHYFFDHLHLRTPLVSTLHGIYPVCLRESYLFDSCQSPSPAKCALCYVAERPTEAILTPGIFTFHVLHNMQIKKGLQAMRRVICVSDYVKRVVEKTLKLDNLVTIHNFVDFQDEIKPNLPSPEDFDARRLLDIPTDSQIITYFGRLCYEKGVDVLVKAFSNGARKLNREVYLVIGGNGPEKHRIEEIAKNADNVKVVGYLARREQLGLMAQSNVFVSPSRFADACPTVLIEAAFLGLPIVATRVGGSPEIVTHLENGLLVEPGSPYALANGLVKLMSDEKLLEKYGKNGPKKANNFDIHIVGREILGLYEEVL
jgi:glycosyltransferase involved in cell wall biosynthesis